ncbi:MAG TPA: (deoxy)nucleoside triphosphate pyrophosphohydrolase [Verrucomicrobiae bacterium]|nr:(deoxy)nucleoside triphosphate pyrophosphohydrolase [Verrucomicrobiae bacterium]
MRTVVVCAAVIIKENRVLIAQRRPGGQQGLLWEFPGGKLIPGETPPQCLVREIREELKMLIRVGEVIQVVSHCYTQETQILLLAYLCEHLEGEGETLECEDFRWVYPSELKDYELAAADLPVVAKLLELPQVGN